MSVKFGMSFKKKRNPNIAQPIVHKELQKKIGNQLMNSNIKYTNAKIQMLNERLEGFAKKKRDGKPVH
jgi:hypothetical protein